jgi:hypothetical protein
MPVCAWRARTSSQRATSASRPDNTVSRYIWAVVLQTHRTKTAQAPIPPSGACQAATTKYVFVWVSHAQNVVTRRRDLTRFYLPLAVTGVGPCSQHKRTSTGTVLVFWFRAHTLCTTCRARRWRCQSRINDTVTARSNGYTVRTHDTHLTEEGDLRVGELRLDRRRWRYGDAGDHIHQSLGGPRCLRGSLTLGMRYTMCSWTPTRSYLWAV